MGLLKTQLSLACRGVEKTVKDMQTATGTKDAYTQHWIDTLIARARQMKKADKNRSDQAIEAELMQWILEHEHEIYSGFLTLKGRCYILPLCTTSY